MDFNEKLGEWGQKLGKLMSGRYGYDQLGMALVGLSLVCLILNFWLSPYALIVAWGLLIWATFRMWSRNIAARQHENAVFLGLIDKPLSWTRRNVSKIQNRKTKAYVRCPHCNAEFSLPKGKGKLRATCPRCGEKSVHEV